jgi:hypothetical protein
MRTILRIIAVVFALSALATLFMAWSFWRHGDMKVLAASGVFGWATFLGWVLTVTLGPYAAVQLWRLRSTGRTSAVVLMAYGFSYNLLGWLPNRPQAKAHTLLLAAAWDLLIALLLLLPSARKACSVQSTSTI